jgi:hypothetical protein
MSDFSYEVSNSQQGEEVAIGPAKNEVVDHSDCFILVIDDRPELQCLSPVAFRDLVGIEARSPTSCDTAPAVISRKSTMADTRTELDLKCSYIL